MEMDWEKVKSGLKELGVTWQEREVDSALAGFIKQCGYIAHPMLVDMRTLESVDADMGIIATYEDESVNNGVSVFCILKNNALGLVTVIPSTVSKASMVRKSAGDITAAITGIELPPMTAFDMIEVTGQVIANTAMKTVMAAYNIPKEKEQAFTCMYLPKFLANVAMYYTGASKDGKPVVNEEIADMEPAMVRNALFDEKLPKIFTQEGGKKDAGSDT